MQPASSTNFHDLNRRGNLHFRNYKEPHKIKPFVRLESKLIKKKKPIILNLVIQIEFQQEWNTDHNICPKRCVRNSRFGFAALNGSHLSESCQTGERGISVAIYNLSSFDWCNNISPHRRQWWSWIFICSTIFFNKIYKSSLFISVFPPWSNCIRLIE
jgi:hypothetical protein